MTTKKLSETVPGDVFYFSADPAAVWYRVAPGYDGYDFALLGSDNGWRTQNEVGPPAELVVVVHNTRKHLAEPLADDGRAVLASHLSHGT